MKFFINSNQRKIYPFQPGRLQPAGFSACADCRPQSSGAGAGLYSAGPPGKGGHRAGGIHHQPPHRGDSPGDLSSETGRSVIFLLYLEYRYVRELAENCRKIHAGGSHLAGRAGSLLRRGGNSPENPAVDGILCGEGEETSGCWQSAVRPDRLIRSTLRKSRDLYSGSRREARSAGRKAGRRFSGKHSRQRRRPQAVPSA